MGLYKLVLRDSKDLSSGHLQKAVNENIDYEIKANTFNRSYRALSRDLPGKL